MRYKVHRISASHKDIEYKLESFLNGLRGEIISVISVTKPAFHLMGATARVESVVVVEKLSGSYIL